MRIAIATDAYFPSVNGTSLSTQRLAHHLRSRQHDVLVVAPSRTFRIERYEVQGVRTLGVPSIPALINDEFRLALPLGSKNKIEREIEDFAPDVTHLHGHLIVSRMTAEISRKHSVPLVGTVHFLPEFFLHYLRLPEKLEEKARRFSWSNVIKVFSAVDYVTAPTAVVADLLKAHGLKKEICEISNGIDLEQFCPSAKSNAILARYKLKNDRILLYTGRLDPDKNIDFILSAVAKVPRDVAIHFAIVGNGARRTQLKRIVDDLGIRDRVSFLGLVSNAELPALYASAWCFVIAGTAETQSIATMEAMASGLPVLAADAVALPELVHTGKNGFLFKLDDAGELTDYLTRIFTDERLHERMSLKSTEIIKQHDITNTIDKIVELYHSLIT
jgi:1,2-diacylglycerol 3-alpha-glucosyltransferase